MIAAAADVVPYIAAFAALITAIGGIFAAQAKRGTDRVAGAMLVMNSVQDSLHKEVQRLGAKVDDLEAHLAECEKGRAQLTRRVAELEGAA